MKKSIWVVAVLAAVLLSGGAAWADDFYVIAGGGAVGTKITTLPYTITSPGFYFLGGNLTTAGDGIAVNADDVTLDLMGFSLTHTGAVGTSKGIYMSGRTNVEIRNGTIRGFYYGIHESGAGSNNHRVFNIRALNPGAGELGINIELQGADNLVRNCIAANNANGGIHIGAGTVSGCEAYGNVNYGFWISSGPGNFIGNAARSNGTGFRFTAGHKIMLDQNSAENNGANYSPGDASTAWGVNAGK